MTDERDLIDQFVVEHYGKMTLLEMRAALKAKYGIVVPDDNRISRRIRILKRYGQLPQEERVVPRGEAYKRNNALTGKHWRISSHAPPKAQRISAQADSLRIEG